MLRFITPTILAVSLLAFPTAALAANITTVLTVHQGEQSARFFAEEGIVVLTNTTMESVRVEGGGIAAEVRVR